MNVVINCFLYFFLSVTIAFTGCKLQGKGSENADKKDVTARDLYRAARQNSTLLLVDGWKDEQFRKKIRDLVENSHLSNWQLIIKDHREVTEDEIASTPTMLIGTPLHNDWVNFMMDHVPIGINDEKIDLTDRSFDADAHSLIYSYYPNPLNVRMPVGLFTSDNERLIWELTNDRIASFVRGNWSYEILNGSRRVLLGNLSQDPESRWEIDDSQQLALPSSIKHHWENAPFIFKSFSEELNVESMRSLTDRCQRQYDQIKIFCKDVFPKKINYYLYPSTEIKGLMTGNTDQSHMISERFEIHTAFDDHFVGRYNGRENELILQSILGKSSYSVLEKGLALYFGSPWEENGYIYWSKHLFQGANAMTVKELLDEDQLSGASSLISESLAGSLVHFLIENLGREEFLKIYHSWQPNDSELDQLNHDWRTWVMRHKTDTTTGKKTPLPYLQGFNFTHEGYQIFNGYGSSLSQQSLEQVRNLGSNTVAIVPYSWMRDPGTPSRLRFSERAGSENDEGVIHAICEAKKQGLYTVLKPHVWVSNSWPGEVDMTDDKAWEQFFQHYYNWIRHYALMAEIYQVDMLCVGVELSLSTLKQEERWKHLISRLRKIYHGNLTYAANWGDEFENIQFWDHLDAIGLNCYYPLSGNTAATEKELINGFEEVLSNVSQVKAKYDKPILFTEIGFRSVDAPWLQPHEEAFSKGFNENHQALAYSAVFQAMKNEPVVDGILWWKWPTNMEHRVEQDRRFVPTGKMAEQVIEGWFKNEVIE